MCVQSLMLGHGRDTKALAELNVEGRNCEVLCDQVGTRNGLTAGQRGWLWVGVGERQRPGPDGLDNKGNKQNPLTSPFESEPLCIHCFPVAQASHFAVCLESMRTCGCMRKTCRAKSLPNR